MLVELYKLAYDLDRKGLHNEAAEIEEVMKLMATRVGLKVEDMVALANHFDALGDVELADHLDKIAKDVKEDKEKKKALKEKEKAKKEKEKEKAKKEKEKEKALKLKEMEKAKKEKEKAKKEKEEK